MHGTLGSREGIALRWLLGKLAQCLVDRGSGPVLRDSGVEGAKVLFPGDSITQVQPVYLSMKLSFCPGIAGIIGWEQLCSLGLSGGGGIAVEKWLSG